MISFLELSIGKNSYVQTELNEDLYYYEGFCG